MTTYVAPRRGEDGFAMITVIMLTAIMATLVALVLFNGSHADRASGRNKNWSVAVHVAESGVQEAIAKMQASGAVPAAFTGSTQEGGYKVKVVSLGRNRYRIDSVGTIGTTSSLKAERGVRVVMAPPPSFRYALFSLTDVNTKNNDTVEGDIWANGSVIVDQGDKVIGSVNAATGYVFLDNGSRVEGDVWSGGYDSADVAIAVGTNAEITGNAKASSTVPGCTDDGGHSRYQVDVTGTIDGNVTTWGNKTGGGSVGGKTITHVCTDAPASKEIPQFTFNPINYDPSPTEYASVAEFQSWLSTNKSNFSGVHFVHGTGVVDLSGVSVAADAAVIADAAPIDSNGMDAANDDDKILVLVSFYAPPAGSACTDNGGNPLDCAIGVKNNFEPSDNTATLVYAPNGPVAFKNNAEFLGAVYANSIVTKNNQTLVYDSRVEQIVGFGPVTLQQQSWKELPASQLDVG